MKCTICNKDEKMFVKEIEEIKNKLRINLDNLSQEENGKIIEFSIKHGFIKENFDALDAINDNIGQMTIRSFYENQKSLTNIEPKLEILYKYIYEFNHIDKSGNILNLINQYKVEPKEERIKYIRDQIKNKRNQLEGILKRLNEREVFFNELEFESAVIGVSWNEIYEFTSNDFFKKRILLCPFCSSVFITASKAAFKIIEAKRIEDEDTGDDEDD